MTDYLARVHGHYASGRPWGFGWKFASVTPLSTMLSNWAAAVTDWWTNGTHGMETLYPTSTVLDSVDVTQYGTPGHFSLRAGPTVLTLAGTSTDLGLPDVNSPVLSLRSTEIGKGTDGRTKLPAPVESLVVDGELSSTFTTRAGVAGRALFAAMTGGGDSMFIWNTVPTISKPTAFTKTTIATVEASNKMGTERSRTKLVRATYS